MSKRFRACEACHRLKTKCDASASNPDACERCVRNKLDCRPAARRWQRDRIAELEAQVRELNDALQETRSSTAGNTSTRATSVGSTQPEFSQKGSPRGIRETGGNESLEGYLSQLVTKQQQDHGIKTFRRDVLPLWPIISMGYGDSDTDSMVDSIPPILLLTILGFVLLPHQTEITPEKQSRLRSRILEVFASASVGLSGASHELIQSLLVAAFWYRPDLDGNHGNCHQLVRTASELATELGLGGPDLLSNPPAWFGRIHPPLSLDMKRTWLACYLASTLTEVQVRRPLSHVWTEWHQHCFNALVEAGDVSSISFLRLISMARLHETIASRLRLCDLRAHREFYSQDEITNTALAFKYDMLDVGQNMLSNRSKGNQLSQFWHHIAQIYINESILHTATNVGTFAAPYIAPRIAADDFARPEIVTSQATETLSSLVSSCHSAIDVVSSLSPETILALPSLCFAPAVSYTLWVLVKVEVSVSAPGNTFGSVLSPDKLQLRAAMQRLQAVHRSLVAIDPGMASWSTRIIGSTDWLHEWLNGFEAIVARYEVNRNKAAEG